MARVKANVSERDGVNLTFQEEVNPASDLLEAKGMVYGSSTAVTIESDSGTLNFKDLDLTAISTYRQLRIFDAQTEGQYFSALEGSTDATTSDDYVTVLDVTSTAFSAGEHLIYYSAEVGQSDKKKEIGYRVQIGGSSICESIDGVSVDNQFQMRSGLIETNLTSGTKNITVDFGQTDGGGTGFIRRVRVKIWKAN